MSDRKEREQDIENKWSIMHSTGYGAATRNRRDLTYNERVMADTSQRLKANETIRYAQMGTMVRGVWLRPTYQTD